MPPPPPQQPPHQPPPPPHQPPQYQYYPYQRPKHTSKSSCTKFCSCILATTFLTILALVTGITLFILFRPKDPTISISAIKFPSFALHNSSTASFTISQFASVHNPNRFAFSHHSSSFHLFSSASGPIGFIYIPAGFIPGGSTKFVSANFVVQDFDVGPGPTLEVETKMVFVGSVMVLKVFSHRVQKSQRCRVSVRVTDGFLLGYHC